MTIETRDGSAVPKVVTSSDSVPWLAIGTLIFTLGVYALNGGFVYPANSLAMTAWGYSAATVGSVGSVGAVGYVLGSLLAPVLAVVFGLRWAMVGAVGATALVIVGFAVVPPVLLWYPMRLVHGMATTIVFVCGESALIAMVPQAVRGRVIGFYTSFNSIFFTAGAGIVGVLGFTGLLPYALIAGMIALLALPLILVGRIAPELPAVPVRQLIGTVASIPLLLIVIFAWGWIDGATLNLLSVFGIRRGLSPEMASWLLSALALGNVFLQFLVGWVADHLPRRTMLAGLAALGVAGSLLLSVLDLASPSTIAFLFVFGAVGFGTFTVCLIALGEVLTGSELVAANAAFGLLWGLGGLIGSLTTGWLMDVSGPAAFALSLGVGFAVQCGAAILLPLRLRAVAAN